MTRIFILEETQESSMQEVTAVDMILCCPLCEMQHIDLPNESWTNPPHRSHLCAHCGYIWRPADVATNGVATLKTKGTKDMHFPIDTSWKHK